MSDLLERFLADRGELSADELTRLAYELSQNPRLAADARSLLQVDELLSRRLSGDRGHFAARVAKRLATADSGTFVHQMLSPRRVRGQRTWLGIGLAAAFLVLIGGWAMVHRGDGVAAPAVSIAINGTVTRAGKPVTNGAEVTPGDMLQVTAGMATLMWIDGTTIRLDQGTHVHLLSAEPKRLRLETGVLQADVAKQPSDGLMTLTTRDAVATVLGTRLRLTCGRATRLDVWEGRVAFSGGGTTIPVAAGEMAECASGEQPCVLPHHILLTFGFSDHPLLAGTLEDKGDIFSAERGYGWERANDGGIFPEVEWKGQPRGSDRLPAKRWGAPDGLGEGLAVGWAKHADAWRLRLPDGRYHLTIAVGGTLFEQGPHRVLAQGQTVVADVVTNPEQVLEHIVAVDVTDGWLRLEVGGTTAPPTSDGSSDTVICYLRLSALE
jgi:hypothetical protein